VGNSYGAICRKCDGHFRVREGGGFTFHLLHCTECGEEKVVCFRELGEIHATYLKGLTGSYAVATAEQDADIRNTFMGEAIGEKEYRKRVEAFVGKCYCGGSYTFCAKSACPKCGSKLFDQDPDAGYTCYD
jgi:rRNA maturation protein Nop10